jgi:hypothetical protein
MQSSGVVYLVGGLRLASTLPLPPLREAESGSFDWQVTIASEEPPPCGEWFHEWFERDGSLWLSFGRLPSGYLLRFAHSASFHVRLATREVRVHIEPGTPDDTLRHLLLNQVLPLLVAAPDRVALHASAVAGPDGVIAFVGPGGSGKSTLAAACVSRGWRLVTDDVLVVTSLLGRPAAVPTFCELRLWGDVADGIFPHASSRRTSDYSTKRRLGPESAMRLLDRPAPLACVYLIDSLLESESGELAVVRRSPLAPRDAAMALTKCAFVLDIADRSTLRATFDQIAALVERVDVMRLHYARTLAHLDDVLGLVGVVAPSDRVAG